MKLFKKLLLALPIYLFSNTSALAAANTVPDNVQLSDLTIVFANVTSVISALAGFTLLIVLIRGGISYMTAQGDPKALAQARNSLTWGVIGFIVILAAYTIISIIVGYVSVPGIGKFCIPNDTHPCP